MCPCFYAGFTYAVGLALISFGTFLIWRQFR